MDRGQTRHQNYFKRLSLLQVHKRNSDATNEEQDLARERLPTEEFGMHKKKARHQTVQSTIVTRKIKSLSKYEQATISEASVGKLRPSVRSHNVINASDGMTRKHSHLERQNQLMMSRRKARRSEHLKWIIDNKKMSTVSRFERRDHSNSNRIGRITSVERVRAEPENFVFKDINLATILSERAEKEQVITLEDAFQTAWGLYNLSKHNKGAANNSCEQALQTFKFIYDSVGELSYKNMLMIGLCYCVLGRHSEAILYLSKVMDKTSGNLYLLQMRQGDKTMSNDSSKQGDEIEGITEAYLQLAEAYRKTKNYLCGINVINQWQLAMQSLQKQTVGRLAKECFVKESLQITHKQVELCKLKKKCNVVNTDNIAKLKKYSSVNNWSLASMQVSEGQAKAKEEENYQSTQKGTAKIATNKEAVSFQPNKNVVPLAMHKINRKLFGKMYLMRGRLNVTMKHYQAAINDYRQCLSAQDCGIEPTLQLASIHYSLKNVSTAIKLLDDLLDTLKRRSREESRLDIDYVSYHKGLMLFNEGNLHDSYMLLRSIETKQLQSQVCYHRGMVLLTQLHSASFDASQHKNVVEEIFIQLQKAIEVYSSLGYVVKSYYHKILMLMYEKHDYYGSQYEIDRMLKIVSYQQKDQREVDISTQSRFDNMGNEDHGAVSGGTLVEAGMQTGFGIMRTLIEAIISILKMKLRKGLKLLKDVSGKVMAQGDNCQRIFSWYSTQVIKSIRQFKFYSYYIIRDYSLSLKYINQLLEDQKAQGGCSQYRLTLINKLMLECMILLREGKQNYALAKIGEIQSLMSASSVANDLSLASSVTMQCVGSIYINNSINMVKSLSYIMLYCQLQHEKRQKNTQRAVAKERRSITVKQNGLLVLKVDRSTTDHASDSAGDNMQILLSAQELLRHILMTDKENSLIYYLIAAIHYQLQEYESSLKYIRQALQFSDDHMLKHYFCKANSKLMLGRYEEAIKDYTNAIIVYKDQIAKKPEEQLQKVETENVNAVEEEEYHFEKQEMINEIYLNRAIAYFKYAYQLAQNQNYASQASLIGDNKDKAVQDLDKFFGQLVADKSQAGKARLTLHHEKLQLYLHTQDAGHMISICKNLEEEFSLSHDQLIRVFYLTKQLNNCIETIREYLSTFEGEAKEDRKGKHRKEILPPKFRRDSKGLKKLDLGINNSKINKINFDLRCLEALKKSSSKSAQVIESSLIIFLELTEEVYKRQQERLKDYEKEKISCTLEELFKDSCGQLFRWSDLLFFIGVMHYELREYDTAIKYFEESMMEKRNNGSLLDLSKYLRCCKENADSQVDLDEGTYRDLQGLFQNRIYCREEIEYNIGVCYLLQNNLKRAYDYLMPYQSFLQLIKERISKENSASESSIDGESKREEIKIEESQENSVSDKSESKTTKKKTKIKQKSQRLRTEKENGTQVESKTTVCKNITPFPVYNRLCSIYDPKFIDDCKFHLSFCLPKIQIPLLGLFEEEEVELAKTLPIDSLSQSEQCSEERKSETETVPTQFRIDKQHLHSVIFDISLLDIEMKPIAPWIKQNSGGVIFTDCLANQSIEINTERTSRQSKPPKFQSPRKEADTQRKGRYAQEDEKL